MAGKGRGTSRQPLSQVKPKSIAGRRAANIAAEKPVAIATRKPAKAKKVLRGAVEMVKSARKLIAPKKTPLVNATPERAGVLYDELHALYPDAHCELDFRTPFELLIATILSAQCTDKRVNMVTPALFAAYPTPRALAEARQEDVEEIIKSTGFFRSKAKSIIGMAGALVDRHGGEVPRTLAELVVLPGVGRKTANVVLGNAFGINEGVVVDTHVGRLALRLGLTRETDPVKVELALMPLVERKNWTMLAHLLIWHGRRVCDAKRPRCSACGVAARCPSAGLESALAKSGSR